VEANSQLRVVQWIDADGGSGYDGVVVRNVAPIRHFEDEAERHERDLLIKQAPFEADGKTTTYFTYGVLANAVD